MPLHPALALPLVLDKRRVGLGKKRNGVRGAGGVAPSLGPAGTIEHAKICIGICDYYSCPSL